ncbi:MAG: class I fructose-bisphosphate aldolase [Myxococcota bacterium]
MLILPYDQFVEHDCRHLEAESDSGNPNYIINLGIKGGYNAVAIHYGLSIRFWAQYDGKIPLVLKINGKSSIPSEAKALSTLTSFVEDGVRLGAAAIGYTMYYGSPRQDEDIPQLAAVRRECERFGLPLIVWAYPRGEAINEKGGRDTSYALESAARMAAEMGATVIKSNEPKDAPEGFEENTKVPSYFRKVEKELKGLSKAESQGVRMKRVVEAAQGVPVLFSGGSEIGDDDLIKKAGQAIDAGSIGFIFGRNMWKREEASALEITKKLCALLDRE